MAAEEYFRFCTVELSRSLGTSRHAYLIYGLVFWLKPQVILEIGSYRGFLTAVIADAVAKLGYGRVVSIDNWSSDFVSSTHKAHRESVVDLLERLGLSPHVSLVTGDSLFVDWPKKNRYGDS